MPYTSPAAQSSGNVAPVSWATAVKAATDYLANPPACRAFHSVTQSLTSGTEASLAFDSESYDTDTMHDNVTNNSRITINTAGLYVVTWSFQVAADTDYTSIFTYLRKSGAGVLAVGSSVGTWTSGALSPQLIGSTTQKFAVADYVEVRVAQTNTSGGANNVGATTCQFAATWIGLG